MPTCGLRREQNRPPVSSHFDLSRQARFVVTSGSERASDSHVSQTIFGVDFTSAPSRAKAITVAHAVLDQCDLAVSHVERLNSFEAFEEWLATPGPWIGGFDVPFGLPRELTTELQWPQQWPELLEHLQKVGKPAFIEALNRVRIARPVGQKYIPRRGDAAAGSSSPMKLVNPPVGLMFFEGAIRLLRAGVSVVPCAPNADSRIALEAYPGFLARQITKQSYKKDGGEGNSPARIEARKQLITELPDFASTRLGIDVQIASPLIAQSVADGSGDTLDAILCAVQAAWGATQFNKGDARCGIPTAADDFEGWIVAVLP